MDSILAQFTSEKNSNLPTVISLLTGFPSFILYTLETIVIVRHWRKFESAFWRLFFIRACIHIIDFLDSVIFFRLGKIPLGYSFFVQFPSTVLGIGYFFWLYLYESQNFISIFLVLTRLTSIIFPMKLRPIWRRLLPLCIFITFIVPLCDTWENLGRKYRIDYEDSNFQFDNTTYVINYDSDYYGNEYSVLNAFYTADNFVAIRSSVILLVASTLLNIITIFLYSKKQRNGGGGNTTMNDEERNVERRLLIFTVLNFLCQLLMALWWIITSACYDRYPICVLLKNSQYWIKDIDAMHSPAWLILWSSKMLRELVCKQIGIGNFGRQQMNSHHINLRTICKQ